MESYLSAESARFGIGSWNVEEDAVAEKKTAICFIRLRKDQTES
jgi:hypothetical protein